jgi:hypothetical protein
MASTEKQENSFQAKAVTFSESVSLFGTGMKGINTKQNNSVTITVYTGGLYRGLVGITGKQPGSDEPKTFLVPLSAVISIQPEDKAVQLKAAG